MPKVLIILSDAHAFPLKKSDGTVVEEETGFFLMELAEPLAKILDAGYEVTVRVPSSPHYNRSVLIIVILDSLRHQKASVRMSIRSRHRHHLHSSETGTKRTEFVTSLPPTDACISIHHGHHTQENELIKKMELENNLLSPRPFKSIGDDELNTFDGVFIPGGHAPLTDLGDNPELGRILLHFHSKGKPTGMPTLPRYNIRDTHLAAYLKYIASLCHGPYAFLSTKVAPNSAGFAYAGYNITSWSDTEEKVVETVKGGEIEKVESALRAANMIEDVGTKLGKITVDHEVVSGANPLAAAALGDKFIEMMKAH
jgi:putative intracellular protease/amidase